MDEAEFLAVANHEGRIISVQQVAAEGVAPGFLMRHGNTIRWGGRALFVVGLGVSAYRVAEASPEERGIVLAEEAGGHLGGAAGTGLAVAGCLLFGVATGGVGLFLCGLAGGVLGGAVGSAALGAVAEGLSGASSDTGVCPSCHAMQREWERERAFAPMPTFDFSAFPEGALPLAGRSGIAGSVPLTDEETAVIRRWLAESESTAVSAPP